MVDGGVELTEIFMVAGDIIVYCTTPLTPHNFCFALLLSPTLLLCLCRDLNIVCLGQTALAGVYRYSSCC